MMVLETMISENTVKLDISDVDKWTVIEQLVDLIVESGTGYDREDILAAVIERERQGSTGIENGIAVPHARSNGVSEFACAVGVSRRGIDFDSADQKPCHLIFLIVAPHQESTKYLKALSAVAYIGNNEDRTARLVAADSPEEVISILGENDMTFV